MHFQPLHLLVLLLNVPSLIFAQMPAIVRKFPETKDMWNHLYIVGSLPGDFKTGLLRGLPTDPWHVFLKQRGADIIRSYWSTVPSRATDTASFDQMIALLKYVQSPGSLPDPQAFHYVPKMTAGHMIFEYAHHLNKNPHLVAVNAYHRLPDTAEALLLNN
ncbi:uncharacterized protein UTRI_10113 [Ustilago trichophora]|uniref:Uncharacterized protein n=1 Tax=Ustilago trichophora TaxID=86804 RepID=A0A5C3E4K2_9BASI|nr:uncharacterized protein UTRI_10113 [Ustilago trichophora]